MKSFIKLGLVALCFSAASSFAFAGCGCWDRCDTCKPKCHTCDSCCTSLGSVIGGATDLAVGVVTAPFIALSDWNCCCKCNK